MAMTAVITTFWILLNLLIVTSLADLIWFDSFTGSNHPLIIKTPKAAKWLQGESVVRSQ